MILLHKDSYLDKKSSSPLMTLEEDHQVVASILASFFRNQFDKAFNDVAEHCDTLMYHAVGTCYHSFVYAIFTMEKDQIEKATICCANALTLINPLRKRQSIVSGWFSKTDYNDYTENKKQLVPIMTLEEDLKVCVGVMASFFRNQFDKAFEDCVEHCDKLLYHAIGTCYHSFIYAVFTMEKDQIERSTICCAKALKVISPMRKKQSIISGWFSKVDYNGYTDSE
ncbi:hypothetical protein HDE_04863 [Halotydeus destructor]|nr:hypothetical protein HDE_04863 [Halotydeus destructor]